MKDNIMNYAIQSSISEEEAKKILDKFKKAYPKFIQLQDNIIVNIKNVKEVNKMKYVLMRLPVFMEDEGRMFLVGVRETKEEIQELLTKETADGYFKKSDYKIFEEK